MSSPTVEDLYDYYEIVNNATESEENKRAAYEKILKGVEGEEKAKRLSSQFIAYFFKRFPDLYEDSFNKLLDLCEDESVVIRKQVVQYLGAVGRAVPEYVPKVADTLTQMMNTDDGSEAGAIGAALVSVMRLDGRGALQAVLNQLETQLDETVSTTGSTGSTGATGDGLGCAQVLKFLSGDAEALSEDAQAVLEEHSARLMERLAGRDEFPVLVAALAPLRSFSGLAARQKLVTALTQEASGAARSVSTVLALARQALKLLSKNVHGHELLWVCVSRLMQLEPPAPLLGDHSADASGDDGATGLAAVTTGGDQDQQQQQQLVRVIAELAAQAAGATVTPVKPAAPVAAAAGTAAAPAGTETGEAPAAAPLSSLSSDSAALATQLVGRLVHQVCESLPGLPATTATTATAAATAAAAPETGDGPAQGDTAAAAINTVSEDDLSVISKDTGLLSRLEDWLLAAYNVCKVRPEALSVSSTDTERALFRQRLQLLGRVAQLAATAAGSTAGGGSAKGGKKKKNRDTDADNSQQTARRMAANLQLLVREFFKPAPTQFRATVTPSWVQPAAPSAPGAGSNNTATQAKTRKRPAPPAAAISVASGNKAGRYGYGKNSTVNYSNSNANTNRRGRRR